MFFRMLKGSLVQQRGRNAMIVLTVTLGVAIATAMLSVVFDVGDKVNQELKSYGANIVVRSKGAAVMQDLYQFDKPLEQATFLREDQLGKIKTIFWTYNILDFAPILPVPVSVVGGNFAEKSGMHAPEIVGTWFDKDLSLPTGESVRTGLTKLRGWWSVEGKWPTDADITGAMVGKEFARQHSLSAGNTVNVNRGGITIPLKIHGIYDSGEHDDTRIYVPIVTAQKLLGKPGAVALVEVSALTTPDNDLAKRAARNPNSLSVSERETWYCTAYVSSIAYQIEEVLTDAVARPVRQVSESAGNIMAKTELLMLLVTVLSLVGSSLAIANLVTANVIEQAPQIGLLKAVGARDSSVVGLVLSENIVLGFLGGVAGYVTGVGLSQLIGQMVFHSWISIAPIVIVLIVVLVVLVVVVASVPAIQNILRLKPAEVLHGK